MDERAVALVVSIPKGVTSRAEHGRGHVDRSDNVLPGHHLGHVEANALLTSLKFMTQNATADRPLDEATKSLVEDLGFRRNDGAVVFVGVKIGGDFRTKSDFDLVSEEDSITTRAGCETEADLVLGHYRERALQFVVERLGVKVTADDVLEVFVRQLLVLVLLYLLVRVVLLDLVTV